MEGLLIRSAVVSCLGLIALLAAGRATAAVRHAIVTATMFGLLLMPVVQALVPQISLPVLPADKVSVSLEMRAGQSVKSFAAPTAAAQGPSEDNGFDWSRLWLLGCAIGGVRLGCGWGLLIWRLRRARRLQDLPCTLPVVESDAVTVPVTTWIGRPFIVLPPAWREWPEDRLSIVLKHEEAHVRRGDWFSLVAARLALAVFWPNPMVWLLAQQQSGLAEQAADGLVVSEGVPAWQYADELLAIAQEARATGLPLALSMGRKAEVARRIEMLLKQEQLDVRDRPRVRSGVFALSVLVAMPVAICGFTARAQTSGASPQAPLVPPANAQPLSNTQFLLSCWIYKPAALGNLTVRAYPTEPKQLEKGLTALTKPIIRTLDGLKASITYTNEVIGGTDDGTRVEILPVSGSNGWASLKVSFARPSTEKANEWTTLASTESPVRSDGWLAIPAPVAGSKLQQLVLVKVEEILPEGVALKASP